MEKECIVEIDTDVNKPSSTHKESEDLTKLSLTSNILVQQGDITKTTANILVNSVSKSSTDISKCGAISQAFHKVGGQKLEDKFKQFGGLNDGDVECTENDSDFGCEFILHISIRKWKGEYSYKVQQQYVLDISLLLLLNICFNIY